MFEKYRWILAPAVFVFIGLIMKFSTNQKQFGLILQYKKYWLILIIAGVLLFLVRIVFTITIKPPDGADIPNGADMSHSG